MWRMSEKGKVIKEGRKHGERESWKEVEGGKITTENAHKGIWRENADNKTRMTKGELCRKNREGE